MGKDRHTIPDSGFHSRFHSGFYTLPHLLEDENPRMRVLLVGSLNCYRDFPVGCPKIATRIRACAKFFFFFFFFFFKCNRTIGSRSIGHRVWSMSLKLSVH